MYRDAYQYLQEIREAYSYIYNKSEDLKHYDYMLGISGINYDPDRVQSSPRQDGLEMQAIKHLEAIEEIKKDIAEKMEWRTKRINQATDLICKIESQEQQEVLRMRYINNMSWSEILEARGCDDIRNQYRLHERAVKELQKILDSHSIATT